VQVKKEDTVPGKLGQSYLSHIYYEHISKITPHLLFISMYIYNVYSNQIGNLLSLYIYVE
jgi:hypothetical protein